MLYQRTQSTAPPTPAVVINKLQFKEMRPGTIFPSLTILLNFLLVHLGTLSIFSRPAGRGLICVSHIP